MLLDNVTLAGLVQSTYVCCVFYAGGKGGGGGSLEAAWLDDPTAPYNRYAANAAVLKAALAGALSPNVAALWAGAGEGDKPAFVDATLPRGAHTVAAVREGQALYVHPSSVNASLRAAQYKHGYLVFLEKVRLRLLAYATWLNSFRAVDWGT